MMPKPIHETNLWGLSVALVILFLLFTDAISVLASENRHADQPDRSEISNAMIRGDFESAITLSLQACRFFDEHKAYSEKIEVLKKMSQVYLSLGLYGKCVEVLDDALNLNRDMNENDGRESAILLGTSGYAMIVTGMFEQGRARLMQGLNIAREQKDYDTVARLLSYLSKIHIDRSAYFQAIEAGKEGAALAEGKRDYLLLAEILSDITATYLFMGQAEEGGKKAKQSIENYRKLTDSHEKAFGLTRIGRHCRKLASMQANDADSWFLLAQQAYIEGANTAQSIGDHRTLSYAYGYLGQLYEDKHRFTEALLLTTKAVFEARQVWAWESVYLWDWQAARLYKALGETDKAILAYKRALDTLQSVRREMLTCPGVGGQLLDRETVEPIFLEFVDILFKHSESAEKPEDVIVDLKEARSVIEALKTVELQKYFQDPCISASQKEKIRIEEIGGDTVVVYPIVLPERLVLLHYTRLAIKMVSIPVSAKTLNEEVTAYRLDLEAPLRSPSMERIRVPVARAQKIYDWIIRPLEQELRSSKITTIVYVPDGILRTIPIAALHDGKQYLIERFAVVTAPGIDLTDPHPTPRAKAKVFIGGLSEAVQGASPLEAVDGELDGIQKIYGGTVLKNDRFVSRTIGSVLKDVPYGIIHIATHGAFAHEVSDSYLLTWDGRIDMNQMERLMRSSQFRKEPVELLTLSACNTATGDDKAALGLGGIAVKSGARSALATLWSVNDQATSRLVVEFYSQLQNPELSKAHALRRAQLKILGNAESSHPFYWAPFLLIGNWL